MSLDITMTSPEGVTLATSGKYCPDNVQITPQLQAKTAAPTEAAQVISADSGSVGLSQVTVSPIPGNYINTDAVPVVQNARQWKVTVASDSGSNYWVPLLTDSWLASNRSDVRLVLVLFPTATLERESTNYLAAVIQGNSKAINNPTATAEYNQRGYGCALRTASTGASVSVAVIIQPLTTTSGSVGTMRIDADGTLRAGVSSACQLLAGAYCVTAWLMPS